MSFLSKLLYGVFCAKRANDYQAGVRGISQFLSQKKGLTIGTIATPYLMNQERIKVHIPIVTL